MRITLCTLLGLVLITSLTALDVDYDIGSFRPTDLLEYTLHPELSNYSYYEYRGKNDNNSSFQNRAYIYGYYTKEKPDYKFNLSSSYELRFSEGSGAIDSGYDIGKTISSNGASYFSHSVQYTKYSDQMFWGIDLNSRYNRYSYESGTEYPEDVSNNTSDVWYIDNQVSGSVGYGRTYDCQEAYQAWFLLKEIEKEGCLSRQVEKADIDAMAVLLYKLRSMHELDSRILHRKKLTVLLDYLKAQNYLKADTETRAQSILVETWQMSHNYRRRVGSVLALSPFASMNAEKTKYNRYYSSEAQAEFYRYYEAKAGVTLSYDYEHPLNNILQLSGYLDATQGWFDTFYRNQISDTLEASWKPYSSLIAQVSLNCNPNNRSSVGLSVTSSLRYNHNNPTSYDNIYTYGKNASHYNTQYLIDDVRRFEQTLNLYSDYQLTSRMLVTGGIIGSYVQHYKDNKTIWQRKYITSSFYVTYRLF